MAEALSTLGFDLRFFLFNLVNFTLVAFLLYKFFFRKIFSVIEERQALIQKGINDQKMYEALLNDTKVKSEEIISQAKQEANELTEKQKQEAKILAEKLLAEAQTQSEQILEQGKITNQRHYEETLKKVRQDAVEVVLLATKQLAEEPEIETETKTQKVKKILGEAELQK